MEHSLNFHRGRAPAIGSKITLRRLGFGAAGGGEVLRVDGAYIYEFGAELRTVMNIAEEDTKRLNLYFDLFGVKSVLGPFLFSSVFSSSLKTVVVPANKFFSEVLRFCPDDVAELDFDEIIPAYQITQLKNNFKTFEAILNAELQTLDLYHVSSKGGFDTRCLTDQGESLFPSDLSIKVPAALPDIKAGARCLAFDLPTAAGFHYHRANEAVLRAYFDTVAGKTNRPRSRNMGDYLKKMAALNVGDAKVIDVLKSLKDLHRNPLMHPEDIIPSIDDAISLYAAIRAAIGYMLDRIPVPTA